MQEGDPSESPAPAPDDGRGAIMATETERGKPQELVVKADEGGVKRNFPAIPRRHATRFSHWDTLHTQKKHTQRRPKMGPK